MYILFPVTTTWRLVMDKDSKPLVKSTALLKVAPPSVLFLKKISSVLLLYSFHIINILLPEELMSASVDKPSLES